MWSIGVHGRKSVFREVHRVLFALGESINEDAKAEQQQLLMEMMTDGNCRGVMVGWGRQSLLAVHAAVQQTCADNELLSRANFAVVMSTPTDCALEQIADRVDHALETLQFQQLDVLLLQAQSLPETGGIYARKQAVLEAWENMMAIQRAGTVGHIGVSDLSMQDVDFLLTAYPNNPPEAWSMEIQLPEIASSSSNLGEPLQHVIAFAHAHSIDILARFPFERLETLDRDVEEEWSLLTQKIAERYRERPFKFLVAHENEGTTASYHMDSHALGDTKVMQTPLQIAVRYLLQKGLVIIPQSFDDLQRDNQAGKKALREIFGPLAHPYAGIHSSFSPHKLYSSLLAREDLSAVDRALPLTTSFPLPTPPRSSTSKTARSRPGSTQERRTSLPVVSHLPSAE